MLVVLAGLMVAAGVVLAGLASYVARRRGSPAGTSLAVLLLAVAWWGLAYAVELSLQDLDAKSLWGDLKYLGIVTLPPAWFVFVLRYTGRARRLTRGLLLLLVVEPLVVLALLALPATHDLIRYYRPGDAGEPLPIVGTGPLFWVHLVFAYGLVVVATSIFVVTLVRVSRIYWRLSATLVAAALLPWTLNALYNLGVGEFARIDLTPFAFVITGGVLVWGLHRERLVNLTPVARSLVVETMADGVVVLDAFRRVVDVNPAAAEILGVRGADAVGMPLAALLRDHPALADQYLRSDPRRPSLVEVTLPVQGGIRHFDARRQPLPDRAGKTAGELVVLRDVTDRRAAEQQLRQLLGERTRIATALQGSLLPGTLPHVEGAAFGARYRPAGDGREIGGDFYDVFPVGSDAWGIVIGDVSGKGAEAAAVTALVRYTVRTLAIAQRCPQDILEAVNEALLRQSANERYCTLAYLVMTVRGPVRRVNVCLGGHPPPLLVRSDGSVEEAGRLGTALGLLEDPDLTAVDVELRAGDVLCLFTDGLIEARRGRDLFGEGRVATVLREHRTEAPDAIATALQDAARDFRGRELSDDLAVLVVKVD